MKKLILSAAAALCVVAGSVAAQASPRLIAGVDRPGDGALQQAQYIWGGHDWCWYDRGWRGPGFYWCGFAFRRGIGWGGPAGWRGWNSGPRFWRNGSWIGPTGYRHREWGGWRGQRDWHGGRGGRRGRR